MCYIGHSRCLVLYDENGSGNARTTRCFDARRVDGITTSPKDDFLAISTFHSKARARAANASAGEMWWRGKIWTFAREEYREQKLDGLVRIDARLTGCSSLHRFMEMNHARDARAP
jgi:hypothetical protein